jgi:predicted nucleic acid-binding Zn ribbon protein
MARAGRNKNKRASSRPRTLGDAIQELFRQLGVTKRLQQYDVLNQWGDIVGERIASVTTARKIENGILFVDVKTAPWRAELALRKRDILERIRIRTGRTILKDIRFY